MPVKVQLENGRIVEFENTPTPEDIDFVVEQSQILPDKLSPIQQFRRKIESTPQNRQAAIIMTSLAKSPLGQLALRIAGKSPEEIKSVLEEITPTPNTAGEKITQGIASTVPNLIGVTPFIRGAQALPLPALLKLALGMGAYSGTSKAIEGKPEEIIPGAAGGFVSGLATGGLMKGGATIIPKQIPGAERIGSALGGLAAGKLMGTDEDALFMGALGAIFPQARVELKKVNLGKVRDYAANKATVIRPGIRKYWTTEVEAYGKSINSLTNDNQPVNLEPLMERMTKVMIDRKLYDSLNEKWLKPTNKLDAKLYKSYETLSRFFIKSGNAPIGKIVKEYQIIRDTAPIDTSLGREAKFLANDMMNSIKGQIKSDVFKKANIRYSNFRSKFDLVDKYIGVWKKPIETARAERFLTSGEIGATTEARNVAKFIEEETGESLKGAKLISAIKRFPGVRFFLRR